MQLAEGWCQTNANSSLIPLPSLCFRQPEAAPLESAFAIHAALAFSFTAERLIDASDDVCRARIGKRIEDRFSVSPGADESFETQTRKQYTRRDLRQLDPLGQFTNGYWTGDEVAEDHQASRMRQALQQGRSLLGALNHFLGHKWGCGSTGLC